MAKIAGGNGEGMGMDLDETAPTCPKAACDIS